MWAQLRHRWNETLYSSACHDAYLYQSTADGLTPESFCDYCGEPCWPSQNGFFKRLWMMASDW